MFFSWKKKKNVWLCFQLLAGMIGYSCSEGIKFLLVEAQSSRQKNDMWGRRVYIISIQLRRINEKVKNSKKCNDTEYVIILILNLYKHFYFWTGDVYENIS